MSTTIRSVSSTDRCDFVPPLSCMKFDYIKVTTPRGRGKVHVEITKKHLIHKEDIDMLTKDLKTVIERMSKKRIQKTIDIDFKNVDFVGIDVKDMLDELNKEIWDKDICVCIKNLQPQVLGAFRFLYIKGSSREKIKI